MSTRLHIVVSEGLLARVDAALGPGQPRADFIRRAVEQALGEFGEAEATGVAIRPNSVSPESVTSAPAEQPDRERALRGAYEVAAKGGLVGELFQEAADSVAKSSGRHAANCKCPVCS